MLHFLVAPEETELWAQTQSINSRDERTKAVHFKHDSWCPGSICNLESQGQVEEDRPNQNYLTVKCIKSIHVTFNIHRRKWNSISECFSRTNLFCVQRLLSYLLSYLLWGHNSIMYVNIDIFQYCVLDLYLTCCTWHWTK